MALEEFDFSRERNQAQESPLSEPPKTAQIRKDRMKKTGSGIWWFMSSLPVISVGAVFIVFCFMVGSYFWKQAWRNAYHKEQWDRSTAALVAEADRAYRGVDGYGYTEKPLTKDEEGVFLTKWGVTIPANHVPLPRIDNQLKDEWGLVTSDQSFLIKNLCGEVEIDPLYGSNGPEGNPRAPRPAPGDKYYLGGLDSNGIPILPGSLLCRLAEYKSPANQRAIYVVREGLLIEPTGNSILYCFVNDRLPGDYSLSKPSGDPGGYANNKGTNCSQNLQQGDGFSFALFQYKTTDRRGQEDRPSRKPLFKPVPVYAPLTLTDPTPAPAPEPQPTETPTPEPTMLPAEDPDQPGQLFAFDGPGMFWYVLHGMGYILVIGGSAFFFLLLIRWEKQINRWWRMRKVVIPAERRLPPAT